MRIELFLSPNVDRGVILDGEDYTLKVGINVGIQPPPKAVGWNNMVDAPTDAYYFSST